ncbi:serine/threonine protein kinase [Actinoallomurus spadix]|uniref:non-specific serine/threonine protein kinase n=1 Tax=Actinoallomurus spadix TaxID=79912 RepID=A0ABN0WXY7_9ACTN|nr:serine/threonine-protein kinase [Actinoallomurus spadix]MCO5989596.1 serine/threonine protein kinase [Actinoallomurus spadix]
MHNQDAASPDGGGERLVAGRYRLLSVLGEGGMGTVWRARDEVLHREVAVKEVRASAELPADRSARMYARMEREAWAAARVNARGVVTIYDVATFDGRPWIVMELVRGRSLADVIGAGGALPPKEAAHIGVEVLAALRAAHGAGVLHRDVKPANVLLADDGRVVLTDFGIAAVEGDTALTLTGEILGSPEYLAPEQALGQTPGTACDLWSLGALLYTAVQGRSPFRRTTALATLRAVVEDELPPPHRAGPLTAVIEGLMRKDPEERMTPEQAERELRLALRESVAPSEADTANDTAVAATTAGVTTSATGAMTAEVMAAEELPTAGSAPGQTAPTAADGETTATGVTAGTTTVTPTAGKPTPEAPVTSGTETASVPEVAAAAPPAPVSSFGPPSGAVSFGSVIEAPGAGPNTGAAPAPARRNRSTAYLIGAGAALLILLGGGLAYALVGRGGDGETGNGASASQPVSVTVAGGATTYDGSCPPGDGQAPWFTATFRTARPPVQFSYRWVSENGSVVDRQWRTLSFREGESTTKQETVRLSTYAQAGTLRSAMAVEIRSPFDAKSNSVPFSVTCRPSSG